MRKHPTMCAVKFIFPVFRWIIRYFCHDSPKTKNTPSDFENPLEVFQADGTISIPKEVILLALSYAIYASSRRGLISADKNQFLPADFTVDSRSLYIPQIFNIKMPYTYSKAFLLKKQCNVYLISKPPKIHSP